LYGCHALLHWGPLDSMACHIPQFRTVKTKTYQLFYDFHTIAFSTIYLLSFLPTYCYFTQNFQGNVFNRSGRSGGRPIGNGAGAGSRGSGGSVRSASYVTSTPNSRKSAPNLSSMAAHTPSAHPAGHNPTPATSMPQQQLTNQLKFVSPNVTAAIDLDFNIDTSQIMGCNDLTAEIDLSDPDLGVAPIHDSQEDTPMFCTPRTSSRIVSIISKQSNV